MAPVGYRPMGAHFLQPALGSWDAFLGLILKGFSGEVRWLSLSVCARPRFTRGVPLTRPRPKGPAAGRAGAAKRRRASPEKKRGCTSPRLHGRGANNWRPG